MVPLSVSPLPPLNSSVWHRFTGHANHPERRDSPGLAEQSWSDDDQVVQAHGYRFPPRPGTSQSQQPQGNIVRGGSPHSEEDLDECIAAWQLSHAATRPRTQSSTRSAPRSSTGYPGVGAFLGEPLAHVRGPVLLVNVGGEVFRTTASTLRRSPFFDSMLRIVEEGDMATTVDGEGRLFVDRSGVLFSYILTYLQSGHWLLRDRHGDPQFIDALRDEAGFYGLDISRDRLPVPRISEYATVWQFREDASLYVDCLEQTIREDPDHQGLFRLCKYSGGLPLDQQTGTKRFKATSLSVQSVIAYFAMRGFSLQHVVEGSMINHTTSADGQGRSGHGVQYILSRLTTMVSMPWTPPTSHRAYPDHGDQEC